MKTWAEQLSVLSRMETAEVLLERGEGEEALQHLETLLRDLENWEGDCDEQLAA